VWRSRGRVSGARARLQRYGDPEGQERSLWDAASTSTTRPAESTYVSHPSDERMAATASGVLSADMNSTNVSAMLPPLLQHRSA
jgi:hypothetical protein